MNAAKLVVSLAVLAVLAGPLAAQDDVRYFERDGVTYREVRRAVKRPVVETRYDQREQTVYRERLTTESQPLTRTYLTPVTRYEWQPRVHGTWNPFVQPYVAYHWVPVMQWERTVEESTQHVTRRELVPEKRVVQVPVRTTRMVEDEVITRTAMSDTRLAPGSGGTAVARREPVGGISRLENDPPRSGSGEWRSASEGVRR